MVWRRFAGTGFLLLLLCAALLAASPALATPLHLNLLELRGQNLSDADLAALGPGTVITLPRDVCAQRAICHACAMNSTAQSSLKQLAVPSPGSIGGAPDPRRAVATAGQVALDVSVMRIFQCVAVFGTSECSWDDGSTRVLFDPDLGQHLADLKQREPGVASPQVVHVAAERMCDCNELRHACSDVYVGVGQLLTFRLNAELAQLGDMDAFKNQFISDVHRCLERVSPVDRSRLSVTGVRAGSVYVDVLIRPSHDPNAMTALRASEVMNEMVQQGPGSSPLRFGVFTRMVDFDYRLLISDVAQCPDGSFDISCAEPGCATPNAGESTDPEGGGVCVCYPGFSGPRCGVVSTHGVRVALQLSPMDLVLAEYAGEADRDRAIAAELLHALRSSAPFSAQPERVRMVSFGPTPAAGSANGGNSTVQSYDAVIFFLSDPQGVHPAEEWARFLTQLLFTDPASELRSTRLGRLIQPSPITLTLCPSNQCADGADGDMFAEEESGSEWCGGHDCRWFVPVVTLACIVFVGLVAAAIYVLLRSHRQEEALKSKQAVAKQAVVRHDQAEPVFQGVVTAPSASPVPPAGYSASKQAVYAPSDRSPGVELAAAVPPVVALPAALQATSPLAHLQTGEEVRARPADAPASPVVIFHRDQHGE